MNVRTQIGVFQSCRLNRTPIRRVELEVVVCSDEWTPLGHHLPHR